MFISNKTAQETNNYVLMLREPCEQGILIVYTTGFGVTFVIEFVTLTIKLVSLAIELPIEFVTLAIEFIALAIECVILEIEFVALA